MLGRPGRLSERLDRLAYSTFVLGAVVPLLALAVTLERFVLPGLDDRSVEMAWIAAGVSIGVLSLGSFFALRRLTRGVVAHMDRDNHRLASLLRASGELGAAQHLSEATELVARYGADLTGATGALVVAASDAGAAPALAATSGDVALKLYEAQREAVEEVARLVLESGRPLLRAASEPDGSAMLAVPVPGAAHASAVLITLSSAHAAHSADESDALSTLAGLAAVAIHNADLRDAQRNFFSHVTDILVQALDAHLQFHVGHSQRVAELANRVGRFLRLADADLQRLHFSALLHDIGMLKLDRNQQMNLRTCDKHTYLGARMLGRIRLWKDLAPIVQHHHEWWDGHGYPDGLVGAAIPREARIIAICDAYDTLTSEESYKPAVSSTDALAELDASAGTQFDPELVRSFRLVIEQGDARPA